MKGNAITRIVLFSIAIVLLLAILIGGIGLRLFSIDGNVFDWGFHIGFDNLQGGTVASSGLVPADEIRDIEVQWVSGSITVIPGNTDTISFSEPEGIQEQYKMVWKQSGDKLIIRFCRTEKSLFGGVHIPDIADKNLVITVPASWSGNEMEVETVSASVGISQLTARKIALETVSGDCNLEMCSTSELSMDSVSGNLEYRGNLDKASCDTMSGNMTLGLEAAPREVDMDSMSGDLILTLPEVPGFSVSIDSMSGTLSSQFPTTVSGNKHIYGNGSSRIDMDTMSGDIFINKAS